MSKDSGYELIDEASILSKAIEEKEALDPDWDRKARVASCRAAVQRGRDPQILLKTYGADVFAEATAPAKQLLAAAAPDDSAIRHSDEDDTNISQSAIRIIDSMAELGDVTIARRNRPLARSIEVRWKVFGISIGSHSAVTIYLAEADDPSASVNVQSDTWLSLEHSLRHSKALHRATFRKSFADQKSYIAWINEVIVPQVGTLSTTSSAARAPSLAMLMSAHLQRRKLHASGFWKIRSSWRETSIANLTLGTACLASFARFGQEDHLLDSILLLEKAAVELVDRQDRARAQSNLATANLLLFARKGDAAAYSEAVTRYRDAYSLFEDGSVDRAVTLANVGNVFLCIGDARRSERAYSLARKLGLEALDALKKAKKDDRFLLDLISLLSQRAAQKLMRF